MVWISKGIDARAKRVGWISAWFLLALFSVGTVRGEEWSPSDVGWFVAGGAAGFVVHEGAHALVAESLGFHARLVSRRTPIPFVVVRYDLYSIEDASVETRYFDRNGAPVAAGGKKRFAIASAGINSQNISSELILTLRPHLQEEPRPFLKGMLAFDILTSIGYALVGRKDPDGDLRGMSEGLGISDRIVGAMVFLPAAVDFYRYYHPESAWAPWASRGSKGYLLGLSFRW